MSSVADRCSAYLKRWARAAYDARVPLLIFAGVRVWLLLWGAFVTLNMSQPALDPDWFGLQPQTSGALGLLVWPWVRWDGVWYLRIVTAGYSAADGSVAFFPLFPGLAAATWSVIGGDPALSAMLVSNLACAAALVALYKLTRFELGEETARRTVLYQAVFPTAFFLLAPYTESLFLLWAVLSAYQARKGRWWWAGVAAYLAALTRVVGVLLVVPLAYEMWRQNRTTRGMLRWRTLSLCLAPMGLATYSAYLWIGWGDPLLWLNSHQAWARTLSWPWETLSAIWHNAFRFYHGPTDVLFFVLAIWLTVGVLRRLPLMYGLYMVVSLALPLINPSHERPLLSMPRFLLVLYPGFIYLGVIGRRQRWHRVVLYSFLPALMLLSWVFINWIFVG